MEITLNDRYVLVTGLFYVLYYAYTLLAIVPAGNNLVSAIKETNMFNQALQ